MLSVSLAYILTYAQLDDNRRQTSSVLSNFSNVVIASNTHSKGKMDTKAMPNRLNAVA